MELSEFLSGEFFLRKRANGGGVVLRRSLWVTVLMYLPALALKSFTDPGAKLEFSLNELYSDINATIPWFGAIFAGSYAAFYTRYSNQWSYLASTYNQIKAITSSISSPDFTKNKDLTDWQAGFISDADTLHLDRKAIFSGVILDMLKDPAVLERSKLNFGEGWNHFCARHTIDPVTGK